MQLHLRNDRATGTRLTRVSNTDAIQMLVSDEYITPTPSKSHPPVRDDCGDVFLANEGAVPEDGHFYANLIDTARNNIAVRRCVYEAAKGGTDCDGEL